jgi:hypothetical protein
MNMASRSLGTLTIDLIAKVGGFVEGMTKGEREADKITRSMQRKMQQRAKEIQSAWDGIGKALAAGVAGIAVGAVFQNVITQTRNAEKEQALLAAALKSTGQQAGYTQGRLNEMAGAMETLTGIGAGDFNQAQTVLLGFTNIVGEQLPEALRVAADFSVRTGATMASAAETIGRALDIPSEGMKSLQRQGFKFSESQIEVAQNLERTGRIAEAQKIVIDALDETYGGAAVAARDTLGGALDALKATINSLLTGEGGSFDAMKTSINQLNQTMAAPETRAAFQAYISWMAGIAAQAIQTAAVINDAGFFSWLQVSNKEAANIHSLEETEQSISATIDRFKKLRDELNPSNSLANKLNDWMFGDVGDLDRQIKLQESKLAGVQSRLRLMRGPDNAISPVSLAPDLPVAPSGSVNLKDNPKVPKGKTQADKDAQAAERYLDTLRRQADQVQQMGHYEKLLYDLREGTLHITDAAVLKEAERLAIQADFAKDGEGREKERNRLLEEGRRLAEQVRTPLQQLTAEQDKINQLYEAGAISVETQSRALQVARVNAFGLAGEIEKWIKGDVQPLSGGRFDEQQERYEAEAMAEEERYAAQLERLTMAMEAEKLTRDEYYAQFEGMAQVHADRMAQIEKAKADLMLNNMASGFGQMADDLSAFATQFGVENKAMLGVIKAASIAQTIIQTYQSAQSAYAAMVGIPVVGPALGIAAAAAAVAGGMARVAAIRSQGFAEGGYTGPGGKYDEAGIVHKGEGVLSQRDMRALGGPAAFEQFRSSLHRGYADGGVAGLPPAVARNYSLDAAPAAPIVNVIEDASKAGQVETVQNQDGSYSTNVFVRNIRSGGDEARALEATYGLTRQGR